MRVFGKPVSGWCSAVLLAASVMAFGAEASAQSDAATAEALFQQGRDLLRAGQAAQACPKLAESQRLDPAMGTLLALAMCHEAEGKFASAWAEFVTVEGQARTAGRADRQQTAAERIRVLRPRLSSLELRIPREVAELEGVEIKRDGVLLGRGAWDAAVPVDGARHVVDVTAPGKVAWRGEITVKPEGDQAVVQVPQLVAAPRPTGGAHPFDKSTSAVEGPQRGWGTLEWAGLGIAAGGVAALGVGGYFLSSALGKKSDSDKDCTANACGSTGYPLRSDAVSQGNTATILGVAGGALLAGGATLFIVGRVKAGSEQRASVGHVSVEFGAFAAGFDARVTGRF